MMYEAEIIVCSEIHTKHIGKYNVNTMWNFCVLSLVVRIVTDRLHRLKLRCKYIVGCPK